MYDELTVDIQCIMKNSTIHKKSICGHEQLYERKSIPELSIWGHQKLHRKRNPYQKNYKSGNAIIDFDSNTWMSKDIKRTIKYFILRVLTFQR